MTTSNTSGEVSAIQLREVQPSDLPIFFAQQADPIGYQMAAFTARDPSDQAAFMDHWAKILVNPTSTIRTIVWQDQVVGNILCFLWDGLPEVGYWLGRDYWGRGIATQALAALLQIIPVRPLYAHAARDNHGSIRVLEKCGFRVTSYSSSWANARGAEIEEAILELTAPPAAAVHTA